jgi:lysophospholipase L1-like esterase
MKKRFEIVGNLLVGLISILFALVVIEVALRITNRFGPAAEQAGPAVRAFELSDNEEIVFEHVPNVRVVFPANRGNPAWEFSTDANAIRQNGGADGLPVEIRGICLGDSVMFGAGLSDNETIPSQLSDSVSRQLGRRFECLNFSVSNYTTAQEVTYFQYKRGLSYEPKIVVLGLYTNDFKVKPGSINIVGGRADLLSPGAPTGLIVALSRFRLAAVLGSAVSLFRDQLREHGLYPKENEKPLRPEQIAAVSRALDRLRADLAPHDIPLLIVLFPRDWQLGAPDQVTASPRQQWAKRYCKENQIVCIDILDYFFGRPVDSYFRREDDSHPHAMAANEVAELLAPDVVQMISSQASAPPTE